MLMFYLVGAETDKRVTCGNVAAAPQELLKNASSLRYASFNGIKGEWFQLYIDEAQYGFAEELEQSLPWRDFERGNYPLYFKSEDMNTLDIGDYFVSEKYDKLCGELEAALPFERLPIVSFGKRLNKPKTI